MRRFTPCLVLLLAGAAACGDDSEEETAVGSTSSGSTSSGGSPSATGPTGSGGDPASGGGGATSAGTGGAGGAGGSGTTDVEFRSGSRLRAVLLDAGGTAQVQVGWYDQELEVECGPAVLDGATRCVPRPRNNVYFRDAACTQPVIVAAGCEIPELATRYVLASCDSDLSYFSYRATGPEEQIDQLYFDSGTSCSPQAPTPRAARPAELAPADTFVTFEVTEEIVDEAIALETISSEDGAYGRYRTIDRARAEPCSRQFPAPADGSRICAPSFHVRQPSNVAYWADDTCTEPALEGNACVVVESTRPILDVADLGCGRQGATLHERGEVLESVWETVGDQCVVQPDYVQGVALGPAFGPGALPELDALERQGDELASIFDARADRVVGGAEWRDASGVPCRVTETIDGELRCLPVDSESLNESIYADAACTERLVRVQPGDCELPAYVLAYDTELACGDFLLAAAYELGAVHEAAKYELSGEGLCAEYTGAGRFAVVGAAVALESFPLVERIID